MLGLLYALSLSLSVCLCLSLSVCLSLSLSRESIFGASFTFEEVNLKILLKAEKEGL